MDNLSISTVNVLEYANDSILGLRAFELEDEQIAKEVFQAVVKEHYPEVTDDEMDIFLEEGMWEQGDYQLFLVYSS